MATEETEGSDAQHSENTLVGLFPVSPEVPEHPEGEAIRQQVEFYFSDQNLPNDKHLLELCGGTQNFPVSINEILGWKKMRRFKPKPQVIVALRKSALLEVVDNKRIRRRIPLMLDNEPDDPELAVDFASKTTNATNIATAPTPRLLPDPAKPWITKGLLKPTGFEDNFAEPPLSAEQAVEEQELYSLDEPFADRIEIAISRFQSRRKFHQSYLKHFTAWMKFGGLETGPRQFTGRLDDAVFEGRTAAEKAQIMANFFSGQDKDDEEKWAVDFEGIAKAYLSQLFDPDENEVELVTRIMRNFYNYLLYHNVCPEYGSQIKAAIDVCLLAEKELPTVNTLQTLMPGAFNTAASLMFGGAQVDTGPSEWSSHPSEEPSMSKKDACDIWGAAVIGIGSEAMIDAVQPSRRISYVPNTVGSNVQSPTTKTVADWSTSEVVATLEVVDIERASITTREMYAIMQLTLQRSDLKLEPLGKMICKPWTPENFEAHDLPKGVKFDERVLHDNYEFWFEDSILASWHKGMKFRCIPRQVAWMEEGKVKRLWFIDTFGAAYCSFYTCLLNDLFEKPWKPVVWAKDKETTSTEARLAVEKYTMETGADETENTD